MDEETKELIKSLAVKAGFSVIDNELYLIQFTECYYVYSAERLEKYDLKGFIVSDKKARQITYYEDETPVGTFFDRLLEWRKKGKTGFFAYDYRIL